MPEREDDHLTPATRLLEKRREMAEVDQALLAQKEEFQMKMESLQQRREELERKECDLKEQLLKFDHFLKENDSKKARALKKADEERDSKKHKDKEIEKLKVEKSKLEKDKSKLQEKLDRFKIYHTYMEKVLEAGEEFGEMRDIIARYDTLTATHEEKDNEILSCNNQLSGLQTQLDTAQSEAVKWESAWTHIKNTAATKTLTLGRIKMAARNLYQLVKRHQRQSAEEEETHEQLAQIQMFLFDLKDIVQELKRSDTFVSSAYVPSSS
ncbi:unnamed protein product [Mytilus edulis]|uniref:DUF4200 domain-containing protein n=1 Tax=Mytilus edulis TaxID=6550 RepID=A0A8S3RAM5_MYTED|nr:unnamed protein product [Mytilus edulis]